MDLGVSERPATAIGRPMPAFIGTSQAAERMHDFANRAAKTDHTVLLLGETGVGKDKLAKRIHALGRHESPFVTVDCGALTESLTESELFGHEKGAFTDARSEKKGLVEVAGKGTLFFNEVANMSPRVQVKFLRILERNSFRAVGGTRDHPVTARIVAATNADLGRAVRQGTFREDLYHRLNVISCLIPPLRERRSDIPELAGYFLRKETQTKSFSHGAVEAMTDYNWPGNVRELGNVVARAVFHSTNGGEIGKDEVLLCIAADGESATAPIKQTFTEYVKDYYRRLLEQCEGRITLVAQIAGIHRNAVYKAIRRLELQEYQQTLQEERRKDNRRRRQRG